MTATADHFAKEAERLLTDEVLTTAFDRVRLEALEALAVADAGDTKEVLRLQAIAGVVTEVRSLLGAMIAASGKRDGGFDPNERPA
jgi:hypothetical protein